MARPRLTALILVITAPLGTVGAAAAAPGRTAVLEDLVVDAAVLGDVVVFGGDLVLETGAVVEGDAVAVGGSVVIADGVVVTGHVVSVFGGVTAPDDAEIGGRVLALASVASLSRQAGAPGPALRVDAGLRLLASGGWLMVTTGLAFLFPARMRYGAWTLPALGLRVPALGVLVALTIVASLVAVLGLGGVVGVPLVAALMVLYFVAKCAGLTVVGCAVGGALLARLLRHPQPISLEAFVGMLVLLALRFVPVAGETLWTVIALVALGAGVVLLGVVPRPPGIGEA